MNSKRRESRRFLALCLVILLSVGILNLVSGLTSPLSHAPMESRYALILSSSLPPPQLISPEHEIATDETRPTFSWAPVENATSYTIQIDMTENFTSPNVIERTDLETTSFTPGTDLDEGFWFWRVRSANSSEVGPFSETRRFAIIPPRAAPELFDTTICAILGIFVFSGIIILLGVAVWALFWKNRREDTLLFPPEEQRSLCFPWHL
ncbi:MAG: hypothetical protein GF309_15610 [Candidatus Lokiarchaeota archaeon]|nr:hypothetical protein [Candidatus Lokiarchaeota archaeon]